MDEKKIDEKNLSHLVNKVLLQRQEEIVRWVYCLLD
jgi:hypothetical protein